MIALYFQIQYTCVYQLSGGPSARRWSVGYRNPCRELLAFQGAS